MVARSPELGSALQSPTTPICSEDLDEPDSEPAPSRQAVTERRRASVRPPERATGIEARIKLEPYEPVRPKPEQCLIRLAESDMHESDPVENPERG
jgi:hypothetical protein